MAIARGAWRGIVQSASNMTTGGKLDVMVYTNTSSLLLEALDDSKLDVLNDCDDEEADGVLGRLMTALGTTYSSEEHGRAWYKLTTHVPASRTSVCGEKMVSLSEDSCVGW